ncbi:MAG: CPBP family intramembrane metalloprotease [Rhodanobacter sp.]|nr:MAG: CPBP family intramembrane metalloprotease [Rhodanobacter sp.]TAM08849.1 MAG: CPBP family intramembrane metalloprotease [Rhodanobacter sp.]TAM36891.1 MAG: CPBP family intramembrane metalloprotease [Rhodanobacter sp.]
MPTSPLAFATPPNTPRWLRVTLYSPPARIAVFVVGLAVTMLAFGALVQVMLGGSPTPMNALNTPLGSVRYLAGFVLPVVLAYLFLVHVIEQRPVAELALRKLPRGMAAGAAFGLGLFSTVVGVLWLVGSYRVTGTNPDAHWLVALLTVGLGAGISEEILTRGVLFRVIEEGLGTWWALALSALFFGFAHAGNPGATAWSSLAIAIEAGILFALVYHLTRSLWPCIGLHAAWNFAQGTLYGIPVSGTHADGWLVSTRSGPDWLSGGTFGAEASVVALTLCSLCSIALLLVALRRGSIVPPAWRRH